MPSFRAACLLLVCATVAGAWPRLRLFRPPPGRLEVIDLWRVDIVNLDDSTYHGLWLHGAVREARQDTVYKADSRVFDLAPGTATKHLPDVEPLRNTWYKAGYQALYFRSGTIPEGDYTIYLTLQPLDIRDSVRVRVRQPGPPRLVTPRDGDSLTARQPFFSWAAPVPPPGGPIVYELLLFEILEGQAAQQAACANPPWADIRGIRSTGVRYPLPCRSLVPGGRYAWQVRARAGRLAIPPSEVHQFWYAPESSAVPALPYSWDVLTRRALEYALHITETRGTDTSAALDMGVALEFLGSARVRLSFSGPGRPGGDSLSPDRVPGSVPPPWWQPDSPRPDTSGVLTVEYEMLPSGVLVGPDPSGLFLSRYAFDILPGDTVAVGDTWTRSFDSGTILRLRSELLAVSAESLVTNLAGFRRYPPDSDGSPEWHRQLEGSAVFDLAERCTRRASFTAALPAADSGRARTVKVTIGRVEVR